jgi:hypothetical protein
LSNVSPSRHIISEETNLNFSLKLFDRKRKREGEKKSERERGRGMQPPGFSELEATTMN